MDRFDLAVGDADRDRETSQDIALRCGLVRARDGLRAHTTPPRYASQHRRIALDLRRHAFGELLAEIHHHQPIGEPHDEVHVVLDEQDRHALGLQRAQQPRELLLFEIAQARGGLVEQQQRGIGGERARDLDDALLAERQAARGVEHVLAKTHARDRARRLGRVRASSARSSLQRRPHDARRRRAGRRRSRRCRARSSAR